MSYTVIVATTSGVIHLGPVYDQRTPADALVAFLASKSIKPSDLNDVVVLLGGTGSTLLHRSAHQSIEHIESTHDELERAFARVRPKPNWKGPIDVTISNPGPAGRKRIAEAISYYTASSAAFHKAGRGKIRVVAAGYYAAVGA